MDDQNCQDAEMVVGDQDYFPDNFDGMPQENRKFKELDHSAADQYVQKYLLNRQEIYPHLKDITVDTLKSAVVRTEYDIPNSKTPTVRCILHFSSTGDAFGIRGDHSFQNQAEFEYHTGCELAYLNAMIALIKYESFHLARVAEEKAKWLAGAEQDASSTFGNPIIDEHMALSQDQKKKMGRFYADNISDRFKQQAATGSPCDSVPPTDNRPSHDMSFGQAIEALKRGERVARNGWNGWNGKGMWLSLSCGETREIPAENFWSPHNRAHAESQGGRAKVLPSITMKTATGEILMGWLASQTDMLAEDWCIIDQSDFRTSTKDSGC